MAQRQTRSAGMVGMATHKKAQFFAKCMGMGMGEAMTWLIEAGIKGLEEKSKTQPTKKAGK